MSSAGADLVWELAEAAKPHLSPDDRATVYVNIGAGDVAPATVERLLLAFIRAGEILNSVLALRVHQWLNCYCDSPDEPRLRLLIAHASRPSASRRP